MLKNLIETITNQAGEAGAQWIAQLPSLCDKLSEYWDLSAIEPVRNMTWHYVAKAIRGANEPVVLKIGFDKNYIAEEVKAYQHFNGHAAVELLSYHIKLNALLLSQAIPGDALKTLYPANIDYVMDSYVGVLNELYALPQPLQHDFIDCREWLTAFEKADPLKIPLKLLEKAIMLKNKLLASSEPLNILHGDLHHDNIIKHSDNWLVIDPRGVVGEKCFEAASFDFIIDEECLSNENASALLKSRIDLFAHKIGVNATRLAEWCFVRQVLGACWMVEDNGDPKKFIIKAERIAAFIF